MNVRHHISLILLHLPREEVEVVALREVLVVTLDVARLVLYLHLHACLRCLVLGENDVGKVEVAVCSLQVPQFKAHHLNLLHQLLVVGIQCVEHIHRVVRLLVCGRVVECEERVEAYQCRLRGCASHLLRFVENDDGAVGGNHVDGAARSERVTLVVDDACRLVVGTLLQRGVKGLGVDDHHADVGTLREGIDVAETVGVVDEVACLLAVEFHEVIGGDVKALLHALTDGDAGHYDNELGPSVAFVQFEEGLDIDVGLSRTRLHLHIELAVSELLYHVAGEVDVAFGLYVVDVLQQSLLVKHDVTVLIARVLFIILKFLHFHTLTANLHIHLAVVYLVFQQAEVRLSVEHAHHVLHGIRLILLYFEFQFHLLLFIISIHPKGGQSRKGKSGLGLLCTSHIPPTPSLLPVHGICVLHREECHGR